MDGDRERLFLFWLCQIPGIGAVTIRKLLEEFKSFEQIYNIEGKLLTERGLLKEKAANGFDSGKKKLDWCQRQLDLLEKESIRFVMPSDEEYPKRLLKIYDFPMGLFVKGRFPEEDHPTAAIIGARGCTNYGRQAAEWMARELSKSGVQIIGGLAIGIDSAGHRGALEAGGRTFAVLGCGLHTCYPRENYQLYTRIGQEGGLLSEYLPDEPPLAGNFPVRNRIISGLSDVVLVMEARQKSGSLITAGLALEQGKEIFALPGRLSDPLSEGCNRLIQEGAAVLLSPEDVLEYFTLKNGKILKVHEKNKNGLAKKEKMVYSCLDLQPKSLEEIVNLSGLSVSECMSVLLDLELSGHIVQTSYQYYGKRL